jgi:hypothetical protein
MVEVCKSAMIGGVVVVHYFRLDKVGGEGTVILATRLYWTKDK